ncbi:ABC transporter ATP-binding protein/permease [Acidimicrobiia bacterium]|nr:ABC transporter ATP-binding protein/permease [Acidimicrobiia bacterium]
MNQIKNIYLSLVKFNYLSKIVKVKKKKIRIFASIIAKNITAGIEIVIVILISYALTGGIPNNAYIADLPLSQLVNLIPFLVIIRLLINYLDHINQETLIIETTKSLKRDASRRLFNEENLSFAYINHKVSAESSAITSVYKTFISLIGTFLQLTVYFFSLLFLDLNTSLVLIVIGLILIAPVLALLRKFKTFSEVNRTLSIELDRKLERILNNFYLIKILKKEESEVKRFNEGLDSLAEINFKTTRLFFISHNIFNTTVTLIISLLIVQNFLNIDLTLEVIFILLRGVQYLSQITGMYGNLLSQGVYVNSYLEGINNRVEQKFGTSEFILESNTNNSFELTDVTFRYANDQENIFEKLNFSIKKNTHNLVIGENGSGKSTLIGLLNGVYKPNNGMIKIFTDKFSYVGPIPLIFNDTLRNNLLYGVETKIKDNNLIDEVVKYQIFEELSEEILDQKISSKTLSSGQMQKVSMIRAFLRNPDILFLDEATSNLDIKSIDLVSKELTKFSGTIINITHKMNQFPEADNIFKIEDKLIKYIS